MSLEAFHHSEPLTLGVELELQLVNTHDYDLAPYAEDMLRLMKKTPLPGSVVPEMTNSMIEISTGICHSSSEVLGQLTPIRDALVKSADKLNIAVVGGGTHPFQQWHERRIYDKPRFRELSELYGYLSKQFTIFGQHVHIGCPDANAALLTSASRIGVSWPTTSLAEWQMPVEISIMLFVISGTTLPGSGVFFIRRSMSSAYGARS